MSEREIPPGGRVEVFSEQDESPPFSEAPTDLRGYVERLQHYANAPLLEALPSKLDDYRGVVSRPLSSTERAYLIQSLASSA